MSRKKHTKRARRKSQYAELKNKNYAPRKTVDLDSEIKQIEEHGFYKSLIEYSLIPVWKDFQKAEKEKREFVLTKEQGYHADVFYYAGALFEGIKRLFDIPFFIEANPSLKRLTSKHVTPQEWFIYHYSNYNVIATGIFDTALIVTNYLLQLRLEPKRCSYKNVVENEIVVEKGIDISLKELDKLIEQYREDRHLYVHRSERPSVEFVDNLNAYRFLKEAKEKGIYKGKLPKESLANIFFTEERNKKAAELREKTTAICKVLIKVLNVWYPAYLNEIDRF